MGCACFGAQDDLPWQAISFQNVKASFKYLIEAYSFPSQHNGANRFQSVPVKTHTNDLVACLDLVHAVQGNDNIRCDQISCMTSSVEHNLEFVGRNSRSQFHDFDGSSEYFVALLSKISYATWTRKRLASCATGRKFPGSANTALNFFQPR